MSRRVVALALLALSALAGACAGERVADLAPTGQEIIGGVDDGGHDAVVFLSNEIVAGCTGTLISSKIVLTAAHCVVDGPRVRVLDSVIFGATSSSMRRKRGATVAWHPDYKDGFPWVNDVAVIVLDSRADVQPIPINTVAPRVGDNITFVGFGLQSSPGGSFGQKQWVTVPIGDLEEQWMFYGPATCQGDSGGPALMTVDGKEVVAGITSWGEQGCQGENAAQRVDLHREWINQQIARYDAPSCEKDFRCITGCAGGDADCPCSPTDGVCSALCTDPESDPDCPRGCGPGDSCVRGTTCPAPDPDCGDPCGGEGHCLETCATRDPDCPAPKPAGAACARNFECGDGAVCHMQVCTNTCLVSQQNSCGGGATCTQLTPQVAVCLDDGGGDDGGGCAVGGGRPGWPVLLLVLLSLGRALRPRSRRASSRR